MAIELEKTRVFKLPKAYPREELGEVLPLPNPISMQVDPASLCNFKCAFCPTGDTRLIKQSGRRQTFMKLELFEKIVADISKFERNLKVLRLFKDGEPMLNPNFIEMVKLAKREKKIERVETTTNGSRLGYENNQRLVESGIDRVVLSVEGVSSERYLSFARVNFDYDAFVAKVRHLYSIRGGMKLHIKTVAQNLDFSTGEDRKFYDTFGPLSDGIFIENTVSSWPAFAVDGAVDETIDAYGGEAVHKEICPYPYYSLSVNADGIVSPCCVDWNRELAIGSVASESLLDIWNGKALNALRRQHLLEGLCANPSCASCGQVHACTHDNLDAHKEKLKKLFS